MVDDGLESVLVSQVLRAKVSEKADRVLRQLALPASSARRQSGGRGRVRELAAEQAAEEVEDVAVEATQRPEDSGVRADRKGKGEIGKGAQGEPDRPHPQRRCERPAHRREQGSVDDAGGQ